MGSKWLLPRLKQLPEARLGAEAVQQRLLGQHNMLAERITGAACLSELSRLRALMICQAGVYCTFGDAKLR